MADVTGGAHGAPDFRSLVAGFVGVLTAGVLAVAAGVTATAEARADEPATGAPAATQPDAAELERQAQAQLAKASPAGQTLCAKVRGDALEWCLQGCKWPPETACLMVRHWGPQGIDVVLHARKNSLDVREVAKMAKMDPERGRLLRLYADFENMVKVDWARAGEPDAAAAVLLEEAMKITVEAVKTFRARQPQQALPLFERALAMFVQARGAAHPDTATARVRLVHVQLALGKHKEALEGAHKALEAFQKVMEPEHPAIADAMVMAGQVLHAALAFAKARPLFEEAIRRRSLTHGEDDPTVAIYLNNLAFVCGELADYRCQRAALERSLAIRRVMSGPESGEVATELSNLGTFLLNQGLMSAAQPLLAEALRLRRMPGRMLRDLAISLNNMAGYCKAAGDFLQARRLLEEAIAVWNRDPRTNPLERAVSESMLGLLLYDAGDVQAAIALLLRVQQLRDQKLPIYHPDRVLSLRNLGAVQLHLARMSPKGPDRDKLLRDGSQAMENARKATAALRGDDHPETCELDLLVAGAQSDRGDAGGAIDSYRRALTCLHKHFGDEHRTILAGWNNLGVTQVEAGRLADALASYRKALAIARATHGAWHPHTMAIQGNIQRLGVRQGAQPSHLDDAELLVGALVDRVEAAIPAAASDLELLLLMATEDAHRHGVLSLAGGAVDQTRVMQAAMRMTGLAQRAEVVWRALQGADAGQRKEIEATLAQWRELARERLTLEGASGSVVMSAKQRRERLTALAAEQTAVADRLGAQLPTLGHMRQALAPDMASVCKVLASQRAALVHYVPSQRYGEGDAGGEHYVALVVDGRCKAVGVVICPRKAVDAQVQAWRGTIADVTQCYSKRRKMQFCRKEAQAVDVAGAALRATVWQPLEASLGKAARVWVVPTEDLFGVAFEALPDAKGRYLVEERAIGTLVQPAALLAVAPAARGEGAVVVGDIDYDNAAGNVAAAASQWRRCDGKGCQDLGDAGASQIAAAGVETAATRAAATVCGADARWTALPQTEAADVAEVLGRAVGSTTWIRGSGAVEGAVATSIQGKRVLHLATHGYFAPMAACVGPQMTHDDAQSFVQRRIEDIRATPLLDPMRQSAIVLAGRNQRRDAGGAEDGILTARDIARLDLRGTALVVLSACETGLGENAQSDGPAGLGRSLMVAGVGTVVASLWQVPSQETAALFRAFYKRLATGLASAGAKAGKGGKGPSDAAGGVAAMDALRAARLELLATLRGQGIDRSAFLWGAFVAYGARP